MKVKSKSSNMKFWKEQILLQGASKIKVVKDEAMRKKVLLEKVRSRLSKTKY